MSQDQEQQNTTEEQVEQPDMPEPGAGQVEETPAEPAYTGKTPGELLREGREKRELTIEDVVIQTRMSLETVRALEEDRDPPQNAWVYVRGYYRKYARALGLSEDEILGAHERFVGGAPAPEPISDEWAPADVSPRGGVPRFVLVLIAGIIFGGLAWWLVPQLSRELKSAEQGAASADTESRQTASGTSFTVQRKPAPRPALAEPVIAAAPESGDDASTEATAEEESDAEAESGQPAAETPQADQGTTASEEAATESEAADALPEGNRLLLKFTERSWVNVVDASGKRLLDGIVQGGSERALSGQPPYRVFLGYAPGVSVSFAGSLIDTSTYITDNNTARFTVGGETRETP